MDFIGLVFQCITSPLVQPLVRHANYVRRLDENFNILKAQKEDLIIKRDDINRDIDRHVTSKVPTKECEAWLRKVEQIEMEVTAIQVKLNATSRCLGGWCPNIRMRMKLGKHILNTMKYAIEVKNEVVPKEHLLVDAPLAKIEKAQTPFLTGQSFKQIKQDMLECIKDDKILKIGVWGMGGIGKTTIMKSLQDLPEICQIFDIVIWVTVSKDWSYSKVQKDIAHRLATQLREDDPDEAMASKIFQRLETVKYLLLLDDVWEMVDLQRVGVPNPTKENGCKIVLTSRLFKICNHMDTDKEFKVKPLTVNESWDLFHDIVGEVVNSPVIEETARAVVMECKGLPLALVVIAKSLRKVDDVHVWKNVLDELKMATFDCCDMEEYVFKILKVSYDRLKDENLKSCFLYCAMYPEDFEIPISQLIEYFRAEGFIEGMQNLKMTYNKGRRIVNDLITASLVEEVEHGKIIKMHDVIRDMALKITSQKGDSPRYLVRAGVQIKTCPNEKEWELMQKISLMNNNIHNLPKTPKCPVLTTLFLQNNQLGEILMSFFEHMYCLRVLDLSCSGIRTLPSSISQLVSLRGLYLHGCRLLLPSEIGALKELEVLCLGYVEYLPVEVGQLAKLKYLLVRFYSKTQEQDEKSEIQHKKDRLRLLPNGMLSNLCLLEEFKVDILNIEDNQWIENMDDVAKEMGSLELLSDLHFSFPTVESLEHFLRKRSSITNQHLSSFHINVGDKYIGGHACYHEDERSLAWTNGDGVPNSIKEIFKQTCNVTFEENHTVRKFSSFGVENMKEFHMCTISYCDAMETIIDGNDLAKNDAVLPKLTFLHLFSLPSLKSICNGSLLPRSFSLLVRLYVVECKSLSSIFRQNIVPHFANLEELIVDACDKLTEIIHDEEGDEEGILFFPKLKHLKLKRLHNLVKICKGAWHNLEELIVDACDKLTEIIHDEGDEEGILFFPKLKHLKLERLPNLVKICKGAWPSLEEVKIFKCSNLRTLPFIASSINLPILKCISGEEEWWEALQWEDAKDKEQLQTLFRESSELY